MTAGRIDYSGPNKKVLRIISDEYPDLGYSYLRKILRNSDIRINGKRIKSDVEAINGDVIEFYYSERPAEKFAPEVVYEDDNLIVFYKPKKMPSQGDNSFESRVKDTLNADYILCHRLDTNTDGLLIFAKNEGVFEEIKNLFRTHSIEKHYYALVKGALNGSGSFRDYIVKKADVGRVYVYPDDRNGGKEAVLRYRAIERRGENTLLDVVLVTGRTHQIRAQLSYHGYPIIGDGKYGNESVNRKNRAKTQELTGYKLVFNVRNGLLRYLDKKEIMLDMTKI